MKKIKFILVALLSFSLLWIASACKEKDASYSVTHNFSLNKSEVVIEVGDTFNIVAAYGDEALTYTIDKNEFASKGKNTPFEGREYYGEVYMTIKGGKVVYKNMN